MCKAATPGGGGSHHKQKERQDKMVIHYQSKVNDRNARLLQDIDRTKHKQVGVARGVENKEGLKDKICPHAIISLEQRAAKGVGSNKGSKAHKLDTGQVSLELLSTIAQSADGGNSGSGSMGKEPF